MEALKQTVFDGLPISFVPWQVLYVIALIALLTFVLNRLLIRPVLAVLAEREARVRAGHDAADDTAERLDAKQREVTERLARARTEAVARLDAAKKQAEAARHAEVDAARQRAEERVEEARTSLAGEAERAQTELSAQAEHFGRRIASRLLGREVA
jgi:F-type H+-transporting ATPase subunit b